MRTPCAPNSFGNAHWAPALKLTVLLFLYTDRP